MKKLVLATMVVAMAASGASAGQCKDNIFAQDGKPIHKASAAISGIFGFGLPQLACVIKGHN